MAVDRNAASTEEIVLTCIVGLVDEGTVYIGGDSAGVAGMELKVRADQKVFANGPIVMGFTDSFRMGQLLRYAFQCPPQLPSKAIEEYMVMDFVDAVRECLKEGGFAKEESGQESGGTFLVGYRGRLFEVSGDYQVGEALDGFSAVGSGAQVALGALYATRGREPEERLLTALEAAERYNAGVRGPFVIEHLPRSIE